MLFRNLRTSLPLLNPRPLGCKLKQGLGHNLAGKDFVAKVSQLDPQIVSKTRAVNSV